MPEHSLQCLLVPHQKFGVMYFHALSEEQKSKNLYLDNSDGARNIEKLKSLFGITIGKADAARALAAGASELWEQNNSTGESNTNQLVNNSAMAAHSTSSVNLSKQALLNNGSPVPTRSERPSRRVTSVAMDKTKPKIITPAFAESVTMLKRINALNIPPLPPDVGTLVQYDGRKYR
jgi:hypothetical protein